MLWKLFSSLAALCLAVAAYYAFISKDDINNELALEKRAKANLAEAKGQHKKFDEVLETKKQQELALTKELETVKTAMAAAESDAKEKEAALELAKKNLEEISQQVAAVQAKIDEAGDIEKLLAQVASLKKEKESAELEVTNQTQALAAVAGKIGAIDAETAKFKELDARQRKGTMEPGFEARISQSFGEWGFAVLNKGNAGGVIANADLEVKRGKDVVAKLKVKNVENAISVVDVVPGSMGAGDALRAGDLVVVSAPKEPVKTEAPAGDKAGAKPAEAALPQQPAAPAAAGDPFGGPAPAATMPAPAAADPFGSPAAMPAPAAADPFGASAATPPAAESGTKASPSTADPFK